MTCRQPLKIVPFNDLSAVERALVEHRGRIAGVILEPVMMNAGIIPPGPGYLDGLRTLLHRHGALLTFDDVKTGFTTGPGGETARYGVVPDIVCLAKALDGGISSSVSARRGASSSSRSGSVTSVTSSASTTATATRTGWCSTTEGRSCRRGARSSSGCCRPHTRYVINCGP
ncbi:aminotransferase class III-fold pyridoxal phosphate-dependent enzyme [Streptomyces sp. NPDC058067]|uniref:aminotransferase class III-fold pyridoxal phosphate-dependent enzyme n=1 Tax=Streptomyces sp. NPDC058067 TaxID=3346324 RepID=UPI0036EC58CF